MANYEDELLYRILRALGINPKVAEQLSPAEGNINRGTGATEALMGATGSPVAGGRAGALGNLMNDEDWALYMKYLGGK